MTTDPTLSSKDCARFGEVENIATHLAAVAGVTLNPMAIKMSDRVSGTYNTEGRRLVVTLGALRQSPNPDVLSGILAHEISHVLQWDAHKRINYLKDASWQQMEVQADALALILLERTEIGQAALRASQESAWSCVDIKTDRGSGDAPAYWVRWSNAVLLRERVLGPVVDKGNLLEMVPLDAFDRAGRIRGTFLTDDSKLAAALDSDAFRLGLVAQGCGVPSWTFTLPDALRQTTAHGASN